MAFVYFLLKYFTVGIVLTFVIEIFGKLVANSKWFAEARIETADETDKSLARDFYNHMTVEDRIKMIAGWPFSVVFVIAGIIFEIRAVMKRR